MIKILLRFKGFTKPLQRLTTEVLQNYFDKNYPNTCLRLGWVYDNESSIVIPDITVEVKENMSLNCVIDLISVTMQLQQLDKS